MQTYLDGQSLILPIPLTDDSGACINASAVEYRIVDHKGIELVSKVSLPDFNPGDTQAIIAIDAAVNTRSVIDPKRTLRIVELYLATATGSVKLEYEYAVEALEVLELSLNSFQSYHEAVLLSLDMPNLANFSVANKTQRVVALTQAWANIGRLNLRYVDESDMTRIITQYTYAESGNVTILTPQQFNQLPDRMRFAICRAQVVEADYLLNSENTDEALRRAGVASDTVGESSRWFVQTKPYEVAVCKAALKELSRYIVRSHHIGRAS